ncbi:hypothetical protein AYI68_g945 [Smittium mucronatum]|uniref:Uncharacterized protein n=1 Tax=Smittium mucronatum TaxID=133383 RepID=A0A1R0H6T1_9FUNG|nr:hypothetical protein AYI68_g945 [Smittium mucronatum]
MSSLYQFESVSGSSPPEKKNPSQNLVDYLISQKKSAPGIVPNYFNLNSQSVESFRADNVFLMSDNSQEPQEVSASELYYSQMLNSISNKPIPLTTAQKKNPLFYNKGKEKSLHYLGIPSEPML